MEVLVQENEVLTSYNYTVMAQLAQLTTAMGSIQAHLNTL